MGSNAELDLCAHGADRGSYCGYCRGYSQGGGLREGLPSNVGLNPAAKAVGDAVERLRIIRGAQFTPTENALVTEAADTIEALQERVKVLERIVFECAPSFQGGSSEVGHSISEALGVGFPLTVPSLRAEAIERAYMPYDLWPWLERMERKDAALSTQPTGQESHD